MDQSELPIYTYHDVTVVIDGVEYTLSHDYSLELTCTRVGGWRLWRHLWGTDSPKLVGGEYDNNAFSIKIKGVIVCQNEGAISPIIKGGLEPDYGSI